MATSLGRSPSIASACTSASLLSGLSLASLAPNFYRSRRRSLQPPAVRRRQFCVDNAAPACSDSQMSSELYALPRSCPGCGAYVQNLEPHQPGFYSLDRNSVKAFVTKYKPSRAEEDVSETSTFERTLDTLDSSLLSRIGYWGPKGQEKGPPGASKMLQDDAVSTKQNTTLPNPPICNRCHDLTHHHVGTSIVHPTIQSIQDIISESPHKYNHIYHVLDAADLPLSLIPSLQRHLSLSPQRSSNRRARTEYFQRGRKAEISFIITRSDLLAPKKEQVDALMPQIVQVLRDALGRAADNARLGNVRCVSSKKGWWTKQLKQDIWNRGGGGWMVGKVNVGKSHLFENVFPKGRTESVKFDSRGYHAQGTQILGVGNQIGSSKSYDYHSQAARLYEPVRDSLLPPAPIETAYPTLPLVSSLPGTTASPIRLSFGNGKGELIDLPGLARGGLEDFVNDHERKKLLMRDRIKPAQLAIRPGQCLLVGGLVRITPIAANVTMLAYPFVPLPCHVTSQDKAIMMQTQDGLLGIPSIAKPGVGSRMDSAGTFAVKWDVTKQRAGPLTRKEAGGMSTVVLPFKVFSLDVLIEGCGWVELVMQVRKRDMEMTSATEHMFDDSPYPRVEIASPDGKHIGIRRPLGAGLFGDQKAKLSGKRTARPRRSMKGVKKTLKKVNSVAARINTES